MKLQNKEDILAALTDINLAQMLREAIEGNRELTEDEKVLIARGVTFTAYENEEDEPKSVYEQVLEVLGAEDEPETPEEDEPTEEVEPTEEPEDIEEINIEDIPSQDEPSTGDDLKPITPEVEEGGIEA